MPFHNTYLFSLEACIVGTRVFAVLFFQVISYFYAKAWSLPTRSFSILQKVDVYKIVAEWKQ